MAINITNTTGGEQFNFLANQSSILRSTDTNKIKVNGVNVIVSKPKKGDIMCVKDGKVIWIDGLSINPKQLSQEIEPVGICVAINGNKAMVRYRKEEKMRWAASERWELPELSIMKDNKQHSLIITLDGTTYSNKPFTYTAATRAHFVDKLNYWLAGTDNRYSAELVENDTDKLADYDYTGDDKIGANTYKNRIVVNAKFSDYTNNKINIEQIGEGTSAIAKHIKTVYRHYRNNGFKFGRGISSGCCRARYYERYKVNGNTPSSEMTYINTGTPVNEDAFNGANCQILRDNYDTYAEYIDSMMIKYPCAAGGVITEVPSGKENTYKLANCTFIDNTITSGTRIKPLYPAAHYAASINVDAPGLGAGNWWLPSAAEMVQMMRDITYGTDSWNTNPDIVNTLLEKMVEFDKTNWTILSAVQNAYWTSSKCDESYAYYYDVSGSLSFWGSFFYADLKACPITIYEF